MPTHNTPQPIIIGCGFLGKHIATLLQEKQQCPTCVVRSQLSHQQLMEHNLRAVICDLDHELSNQSEFDLINNQIYYLAPPSSSDNKDHRIDNFLSLCRTNQPSKIVYISTSGVYGDCQGNWVSEESPVAPISTRAKRRVYAEKSLTSYCNQYGCDYIILRVGGIYGPDRLPIDRLKNLTVICPEEAPYSNRIHVADLASVCFSAMSNNIQNEVINVSDGNSTSMSDYYYKIADFAGLPRPPCVPMSEAQYKLSAGMLSFINESRLLSTEKMNRLLDIEIQFPTLELGLEDCFKNSALKNL
ncbi:MAG: NAD-dependent epimerase/dehydratase family protein [Gammaproteobacteria bacterium]|nr:NAD-dependent epimerase/dehydratase family protein [Gammaproteobacteria bacterium]